MEGGAALELEARGLQHQHVGLFAGKHIFRKGRADIAAQKNTQTLLPQHGRRQADRGGLAAGAGHRQHGLAVKGAPGQLHLGQDLGTFRIGMGAHHLAQAHHGQAGAGHHHLRTGKELRPLFPQHQFDAFRAQGRGLRFVQSLGIALQQAHPGALPQQKTGRCLAGTPGAHHYSQFTGLDAPATIFILSHVTFLADKILPRTAPAGTADRIKNGERAPASCSRSPRHQRSFSTDRATSPSSADVIQNRMMIFDSGMPFSSK